MTYLNQNNTQAYKTTHNSECSNLNMNIINRYASCKNTEKDDTLGMDL